MTSTSVPRGYRDPNAAVGKPQFWRAPLYFSVACWFTTLGSLHEIGVRQVLAYLPGSEPLPGSALTCFASLLAALGALVTRRLEKPLAIWFSASLLACSVLVGASAALLFVSFASAHGPAVRLVVLTACSLSLGLSFGLGLRVLAPLWRRLKLFQRVLNPWFVLASLVVLGVSMSVSPTLGLLRTASVAAMLLALWAFWHPTLHWFLQRRRLQHERALKTAAALLFALHALSFALAERWVSLDDLAYFHNAIVYAKKSARSELVVTAGGGGTQLFIDHTLKFSDHDADRYYESLVQPALALAKRPRRVALLCMADGMATRQLLEHPDVERVDLVTLDDELAQLARDIPWLSAMNSGALSSNKVHVVEAEPLSWLERARSEYDVVIVDLLDPTDYRWGKNYTTHFYRLIARRLAKGGIVAVQATSPFDSPRAFANVRATVRSAGLETLAYRAAVPSLGEWGFVLASREPLAPPRKVSTKVQFLSNGELEAMFHLPKDVLAHSDRASTLYDQRIVRLLWEERKRRR